MGEGNSNQSKGIQKYRVLISQPGNIASYMLSSWPLPVAFLQLLGIEL